MQARFERQVRSRSLTRRSLTRQALWIVLAAQIVCACLLCGAALLHERSTRFRALDMSLEGRADSLLGAIQDAEDPDDTVAVDPRELKIPVDDVYAVYDGSGRLLGSSKAAPAALIARGSTGGFRDVRSGGATYRVLQRDGLRVIDRAESGGAGLSRPVTILYASPERHVWREIVSAARFYLVSIALAATATALLVAFLLGRALAPLSELAAAASQVSARRLHFEPPPAALALRELRPLAEVLARVVQGLGQAFEQQHRFVGDAAHELKTANAVLRSSVQLLMLRRRSEEEYRAGLTRVLEDTERLEVLTAQMLELARLEERPRRQPGSIDLASVALAVAKKLEPVAAASDIEITCSLSALSRVLAAEDAAEILISNLLQNALQHSSPGASVSLLVRPAAGGFSTVEIADQGEGIGAHALPHIFERFYREDVSRARQTGGAGLGLAICKSIMDEAGGSIAVESTRGVGTTVRATFRSA